MNSRISRPDVTDIRLEMLNINGIKANDCRIQSHITFCDMLTPVEWSPRCWQVLFNSVKRFEQWLNSLFICFLSGCKAAFVDTIVYVVISPSIRLINLLPKVFRIKRHILILLRKKIVELCPGILCQTHWFSQVIKILPPYRTSGLYQQIHC